MINKKKLKYLGVAFSLAYTLQLATLAYINLFPYEVKEKDNNLYSIKLGMGNSVDFIPLVGLINIFFKDSCRLVITKTDGISEVFSYDTPEDIKEDYREIWNE